jgi:hypothetical protein
MHASMPTDASLSAFAAPQQTAPTELDVNAAFDALAGGAATIRPHALLNVAKSLGFSSWTHEECVSMTALSSAEPLNRKAFAKLVGDVRARVPS